MKKTACVDLDGTLIRFDEWRGVEYFGDPLPGAKEFLSKLREKFDVVIYTCRCTEGIDGPEKASLLRNRVRDELDRLGFEYDHIWIGQGKPIASVYIDDKGMRCDPAADNLAYQRILYALGFREDGSGVGGVDDANNMVD